jgi:hypothetical protein
MADSGLSLIQKGLTKPKKALRYISRQSSRKLYRNLLGPSIFFNSKYNLGSNIFESDWDLLIVLDTCRPDAIRSVVNEYPFIDSVSEKWSVGGDSWEWIANTFDKKYSSMIENTAYITSNPWAITVLENEFESNHHNSEIERSKVKRLRKWGEFNLVSPNEFSHYQCLYDHGVDSTHTIASFRYPSPRSITNHGIAADRKSQHGKIILHYMPPHAPYISKRVSSEDRDEYEGNTKLVEKARDNTSWEAYLDNLRWGLDEVSLVLQNMNRDKVIITADHGECFSSCFPSHISGQINRSVRKVPWVETTASDERTYEPDIETNQSEHSPEDVLDALGYK